MIDYKLMNHSATQKTFIQQILPSPTLWSWLSFVLRIGLALVYIIAGTGKIMDMQGFAEIIKFYDILPFSLIPFVALGLPIIEVIAGLGLILNRTWALHAITAMTILFMFVLGYAIWNDIAIGDCGCFAPGEVPQGHDDGSALREALIRDIGLLAASVLLYIARWRQ